MTTFRYGNFDALLQKGSGISGDEVDRKIEEAMESVDSKYDDTKIFADRASFPSTGLTDVLYIAQDSGISYIWNGSDYEAVQSAMTEAEIRTIVV